MIEHFQTGTADTLWDGDFVDYEVDEIEINPIERTTVSEHPYDTEEFKEALETGRKLLTNLIESNDLQEQIQAEAKRAEELGTFTLSGIEYDPEESEGIPGFSNPYDSELNVRVSSTFICDNERAEIELPWVITVNGVRMLLFIVVSTAPDKTDRNISILLKGVEEDDELEGEEFQVPLCALDAGEALEDEIQRKMDADYA